MDKRIVQERLCIGLPGELWQAEVALGRLYLAHEKYEQATQAFARAMVIVERLASALTSDELRSHFLASSQVQDLFTLQEESHIHCAVSEHPEKH